jgi:GR25 family glycosyltransferase involved in LPS biosynthesis
MSNYVDNVYLINMDKDDHRLTKVTKETKKVGIKFERFPGVKVSDVSQNILDKYIPEEIQKYGTNGMIGCGLSHLFIWQNAVKNNYRNILVLEDDVHFTDDFNQYLQNVCEEIPNDYDILYLHGDNPQHDSRFTYIYKPTFPLLTHAMIISNQGLKKLLDIITEIDDHIDWKIARNAKQLNIYSSKKQIVNQLWDDSNNSNLKTFPRIINYYLHKIHDSNGMPKSYGYNFQLYKYKDYIITRMTYFIFDFGILANVHGSILLLCLLYFSCDYDRFHLIIFSSGYFIGNIFKYILTYYILNQCTVLFSYVLLGVLLYILNFPFILIQKIL